MNKVSNAALLLDEQMGELATPLVRYLSKKVRNDEDANDLAQEAFLRMHKFQQSRRLDNARAFLFKTANNLVIDQMRRARVHDKYLSFEMLPEQSDEENDKYVPSAERTVSAEQELDQIYKVVDRMPEKVRRAFLMHRGKDLSYPEIASEMGVSTSMVEKYIIQALKILREEMS
jgi:RNA polymerase sigma factor (sigma-70 family)